MLTKLLILMNKTNVSLPGLLSGGNVSPNFSMIKSSVSNVLLRFKHITHGGHLGHTWGGGSRFKRYELEFGTLG